jgi:anthranilate synthase component 1
VGRSESTNGLCSQSEAGSVRAHGRVFLFSVRPASVGWHHGNRLWPLVPNRDERPFHILETQVGLPTIEQFKEMAREAAVVPLGLELAADIETPLSVYLKLRGEGPSFLLESVEKAEQVGRYSFLGFHPSVQVVARGREITVRRNGGEETRELASGEDPLHVVASELSRFQPMAPVDQAVPEEPPLLGGAVGYLGYDLVRFFEHLPDAARDDLGMPDLHMVVPDLMVAFDHVRQSMVVVAYVQVGDGVDLDTAYDQAVSRLKRVEQAIRGDLPQLPEVPGKRGDEIGFSMTQGQFEASVRRAKEYIRAGDIFQVVLSQRLSRPTKADPLGIYRALRRINPSPYMFFLDMGGQPRTCLIGSSPEVLVRLKGRLAEVRPIAGTRPRGEDPQADDALEAELLADPKERAEHVMLVDLGRNDLGRVCRYGTVEVPELFTVERYSHVMHIVSRVTGRLREELDGHDLLRATFPAGTVSGAPKVRAMEIIEELEGVRRGAYAGAVGYLAFNGNVDTCITIRTIVMRDGVAFLQAGAGIVADSDPTREWEETLHKARALGAAIDMAESGN